MKQKHTSSSFRAEEVICSADNRAKQKIYIRSRLGVLWEARSCRGQDATQARCRIGQIYYKNQIMGDMFIIHLQASWS